MKEEGWVPIHSADDLPKKRGSYLVTVIFRVSGNETGMRDFNPESKFDQVNWLQNFTAWAVAPEPYDEKQ